MRIVLFLLLAAVAHAQSFHLQLFTERVADLPMAEVEAGKLQMLVRLISPHLDQAVTTDVAKKIERSRFAIGATRYDVPNQRPTVAGATALLLTHENIGAQGLAGPEKGCVSVTLLREKTRRGGNSAEILVHEWLHTLYGRTLNGRAIPHVHANAENGFPTSDGRDAAGDDTWLRWYAFVLR